jgi:predicted HTH transcriptional regulator
MAVELSLIGGGQLPPEGKTLDYKRDLSGPDTVLRTIIAFANSAGGQLVVGVEDDHTIVGVDDPSVAEERLANLVADSIRPQLVPTIARLSADTKTVLVVNVPVGSHRPYYLKSVGRYQGTFVRLGSSNRQATALLVDDLARSSGPDTFDRLIAANATMADLDIATLAKSLQRPLGDEELLTLELAGLEDGHLKPTNAGILVAGRTPQRFFPHAWVQCARFKGPDGLDMADQASIYGPLPQAIDQVMAFLARHRYLRAEFDEGDPNWDWRRKDIPSIPEPSIRELVINALVHSSYSYGRTAIKVAFFDEAITIENPGGLMPGVTIDQITHGMSVLRNPVVARVFREMHLIESWGSGLRKAIRDMTAQGYGPPDVEELHERLRVTVHIPNHDPRYFTPARPVGPSHDAAREPVGTSNEQVSEQVGHQAQHQVSQDKHNVEHKVIVDEHKVEHKVSDAMHKVIEPSTVHLITILTLLQKGSATRADVFDALSIHNDHRAYGRHLAPLIKQGLVSMTNPGNPRASTQRYQLTQAGRALLAELQKDEAS